MHLLRDEIIRFLFAVFWLLLRANHEFLMQKVTKKPIHRTNAPSERMLGQEKLAEKTRPYPPLFLLQTTPESSIVLFPEHHALRHLK